MSIVDNRQSVGGRPNLVDALAAVVILILIPVAYGGYLLFRAPAPKLLAVSPSKLNQGHNLRVEIEGINLRPFMRVSFNAIRGRTFLLGSTKFALVDLPDLPPGTYDVVLYNYMQEVDRMPKALTVIPTATDVEVEVVGSFKLLPDAMATHLKSGDSLPASGDWIAQVVTVGTPTPGELRLNAGDQVVGVPVRGQTDVPATLRVKCYTVRGQDGSVRCMVPAGPNEPAVVAPNGMLTLSSADGWVAFQIAAVHPATAPPVAAARVRFVVRSELLGRIKAGDRDSSVKVLAQAHSARLTGLAPPRPLSAASASRLSLTGEPLNVLDASLDVPVDSTPSGWTYKDQPLKAGAPFIFETAQYIMQGEVISVTPHPNPPAHR